MVSRKVWVNPYAMGTVYYDEVLPSMPYAQAGICYGTDGTRFLYSYVTMVCSVDRDGWLECTGTYSQTTRKHIGAFLKAIDANISYSDVRDIAGKCIQIQIHTGKIRESVYWNE